MKEQVRIEREATGREIFEAIEEASRVFENDEFGVEVYNKSYRYQSGPMMRVLDSFNIRIARKVIERGFFGRKLGTRKHESLEWPGISFPYFRTDCSYQDFEISFLGPVVGPIVNAVGYKPCYHRALTEKEKAILRRALEKFLGAFYNKLSPVQALQT